MSTKPSIDVYRALRNAGVDDRVAWDAAHEVCRIDRARKSDRAAFAVLWIGVLVTLVVSFMP